MFFIKAFIITFALLYTSYRIGILAARILKIHSLSAIVSTGFLIHFAVFQMVSIPFLLFHLNFNSIYYLYIFYTLIIILASYYKTKSLAFECWKNFLSTIKQQKLTFLLSSFVISVQIFLSSYLFHFDADDSFYVSLINDSLGNSQLYAYDPSTGIKLFKIMPQYIFESWELFEAIISKLFNVAPAILAHSIIPCFLILITYSVHHYLAEKLEFTYSSYTFLLFIALLNIMGAYTDYSSSFFLLARVWQGKSVIINIIIPFIYIYFKDQIDDISSKKPFFMMTLLSISGMAFNPIAVYLIPLLLSSLAIFHIFYRTSFKKIIKTSLQYLITIIPLLIFSIVIKVNISKSFIFDNPSSSLASFSSTEIFKLFFMDKRYFILFCICAIYLLFRGNRYSKIIAVGSPLFLTLFVFNPAIAPFVAQYLTSFPTYWRVFWLLPLTFVIAYSYTHFLNDTKIKTNKICSMLVFTLLFLSTIALGRFAFSRNYGFSKHDNIYKIPEELVQVSKYSQERFNNDSLILAPEEINITLRQISNSLVLFRSRDFYMQDSLMTLGKKEEYLEREELYYLAFKGNFNNARFNELIDKYKIDVVIINKNNVVNRNQLINSRLKLDKETYIFAIYVVNK